MLLLSRVFPEGQTFTGDAAVMEVEFLSDPVTDLLLGENFIATTLKAKAVVAGETPLAFTLEDLGPITDLTGINVGLLDLDPQKRQELVGGKLRRLTLTFWSHGFVLSTVVALVGAIAAVLAAAGFVVLVTRAGPTFFEAVGETAKGAVKSVQTGIVVLPIVLGLLLLLQLSRGR